MRRTTTRRIHTNNPSRGPALFLLCSLLLANLASAQLLGLGVGGLLDPVFELGGSISAAVSLSSCSLLGGLLSITAPCSVGDLEWSAGNIALSGQGSLQLTGQSNAYYCGSCGSAPLQLSGGSFGCSSGGSLLLNSGSSVALESSSLNNAQVQLQDYSSLVLQSCNVANGLNVQGSANAQANVQSGTTVCASNCHFSCPTSVPAGGSLQVAGAGQVQVGDNSALQINGGSLACTGSCGAGSSANIVVGDSASGSGVLSFSGSSPSTCSAGVINLQGPQSQLQVQAGATKQVAAATVITGQGSASIAGSVNIAAPYTCDHASTSVASSGSIQVQGSGQLIVAPGHSFNIAGGAQLSTSSASASETHICGSDSGEAASINIQPSQSGAAVTLGAGHKCGIRAQGSVNVLPGAELRVTGNSEFHGAGQVQVQAQGTHTCAAVHTNNHAATVIAQGGNLEISGTTGQYVCGAGHTLTLAGATVNHANVAAQNTIVIGSDTAAAAASKVECAAASAATTINSGANIAIKASGQLHVAANAALNFAGKAAVSGAGALEVEGACVAKDVVSIASPCNVRATGQLAAQGAGQVKLAGSQATAYSAQVVGDTASAVARAGSNFCIGDKAGSAAAALILAKDTASSAPCTLNGGVYELRSTGQLQVAQGAKAVISAPCKTVSAVDNVSGAGVVNVAGELSAQASHTSTVPVQVVSSGVHTLNCGVQHSFSSLSYASGSTANLAAGASGFTKVAVSGAAQLGGHLNIQPGSYVPSGPVTLYQCGSISGNFQSVTSASATIKGAVQTTANSVVWYPNASQCTGNCTPCA